MYFLISTLFSLPKQIFLVYLGTLLVRDEKKDNKAQTIVFSVILVITFAMAIWLWRKMKAIKIILLEEQEQRRKTKQTADGHDEEERIDNEWGSLSNDVRNDGSGGLYAPAQLTYHPIDMGPDTAQYNKISNSGIYESYNSRIH